MHKDMRWTRLLTLTAFYALVAIVMSGCGGCNSDDSGPQEIRPAQLSQRGEGCRASNDCVDDLSCLNNVCVTTDTNLAVGAGECAIIECDTTDDCCELSETCQDLQEECEADGGDPGSFACQDFENFGCECTRECIQNICVETAVECEMDEDCFGDEVCDDGTCVAEEECTVDANCPFFHTCMDNQCVETGCTNDRECIQITQDERATCIDGECQIACQNDLDCGGLNSGSSFIFVCENNQCVSAGCETDEECRIRSSASNISGDIRYECQMP